MPFILVAVLIDMMSIGIIVPVLPGGASDTLTRAVAEKLSEALVDIGAGAPDAGDLKRARTLFAQALETPGGLKIQTIHAFCEQLLRRFPLEASISPHFQLLDDRDAAEAMAESREAMLAGAGGDGRADDLRALAAMASIDDFAALAAELLISHLRRAFTPTPSH